MIRVAETENGLVRGIEAADPRITAFKGIPFAAPPVGENRWRAPQPAENWDGIRDVSRFAPIAMQSIPGLGTDVYCREWHVVPEIPMDEDCLYLNIWTSAKDTSERQPVLVWYLPSSSCQTTRKVNIRSGSTMRLRRSAFSYSGCFSMTGSREEKTSSTVCTNSGSLAYLVFTCSMTLAR